MIGCLRFIALYFEFENGFKFYNLEARLYTQSWFIAMIFSLMASDSMASLTYNFHQRVRA